jgi:hypothetical protein
MTSYLKATKTDVKEARKILKQSREIYSKREQLKVLKEKIWKKSEMKKVNPLPMQSTRRETAEANKRVPVFLT